MNKVCIRVRRGVDVIGWLVMSTAKHGGFHTTPFFDCAWQMSPSTAEATLDRLTATNRNEAYSFLIEAAGDDQ